MAFFASTTVGSFVSDFSVLLLDFIEIYKFLASDSKISLSVPLNNHLMACHWPVGSKVVPGLIQCGLNNWSKAHALKSCY